MGTDEQTGKSKKNMSEIIRIILLAASGYLALVALICYGIQLLWDSAHKTGNEVHDIYGSLAVSVIIAWILYLIAYYIWAIYFYNVNQGWTDDDWEKHKEKTSELSGMPTEEEPDGNPNKGESLGLPPGTVRATLALTLLVGGLAMLIASFSFKSTYPANQLFVDNFEFIKTGFLMMIAFYFGAKSLDILRKTNMGNSVFSSGQNSPPAAVQSAEEKPANTNTVG